LQLFGQAASTHGEKDAVSSVLTVVVVLRWQQASEGGSQ